LHSLTLLRFCARVPPQPAPVLPFRVGHGFDLHRLAPGLKLVLGGVDVPHTKGCEAHSDGAPLECRLRWRAARSLRTLPALRAALARCVRSRAGALRASPSARCAALQGRMRRPKPSRRKRTRLIPRRAAAHRRRADPLHRGRHPGRAGHA
jgi:hypothetical protein